jgi:hypothetical protein
MSGGSWLGAMRGEASGNASTHSSACICLDGSVLDRRVLGVGQRQRIGEQYDRGAM